MEISRIRKLKINIMCTIFLLCLSIQIIYSITAFFRLYDDG